MKTSASSVLERGLQLVGLLERARKHSVRPDVRQRAGWAQENLELMKRDAMPREAWTSDLETLLQRLQAAVDETQVSDPVRIVRRLADQAERGTLGPKGQRQLVEACDVVRFFIPTQSDLLTDWKARLEGPAETRLASAEALHERVSEQLARVEARYQGRKLPPALAEARQKLTDQRVELGWLRQAVKTKAQGSSPPPHYGLGAGSSPRVYGPPETTPPPRPEDLIEPRKPDGSLDLDAAYPSANAYSNRRRLELNLMPGREPFQLGHLHESEVRDVLGYMNAYSDFTYHAAHTGVVLTVRRPNPASKHQLMDVVLDRG